MRSLLLLHVCLWLAEATKLCDINCYTQPDSFVQNECVAPRKMANNCCKDQHNIVLGIDLRGCGLTNITTDYFSSDADLKGHLELVLSVDLSNNSALAEIAQEAFRGMTNLSTLQVPTGHNFSVCPGEEPPLWVNIVDGKLCMKQTDYCNKTDATCPKNSFCSPDGPGMVQCLCEADYHGYKCLKKGTFPFAAFYGSLGATTLVLSAILWYTQRRHVRQKHD